jgi:arabinose-5-phosphate isomerase
LDFITRCVKEDPTMSTEAALRKRANAPQFSPLSEDEVLRLGREVVRTEARALNDLVKQIDSNFFRAVRMMYRLSGDVIITGMGKAGHIGQKLAATFSSTGTRAHFLHPAEAIHGDLGRVRQGDLVIAFSQSGETSEVVGLIPSFRRVGVPLIAVTSSRKSTLGREADITIQLGQIDEACSLGLAPSTSTAVMLALGDALALVVSRLRGFAADDFAKFHPGGSLGLKLSAVEDSMRGFDDCRVANENLTIRQVLVTCTKPGRRSGAIMLTDHEGRLTGLFTDSDLARLIESRHDVALDRPVVEVMIKAPLTIGVGARLSEAVDLLADRKISELPVVDGLGKPVGLIDVTDLMSMMPTTEVAAKQTRKAARPSIRIYDADEYAD